MLLRASVVSVVRKKMTASDVSANDPDVLVSGMLTALVSASFIVLTKKIFALPISPPHTIIDYISGFSIVAKGFGVRDLVRADQMHACMPH